MADLIHEVRQRYSKQYLAGATNPDNSSSREIGHDALGRACTDVAALFEVYAGVAYDSTDSKHIAVAVEGVIALLLRRNGRDTGGRYETFIETLAEGLGRVEGRNRVTPKSKSALTPSAETRLASTPRPWADDSNFDDFVPDNPT